jgi:regulator of sigma E protease
MAKRAGIWVEEFGFGLPPRVAGIKLGETLYSINFLPFGGFVRLHGENTEDEITKPKRAFLGKNKRTRLGIIVAGVVMNFLLAIAAFSVVYSFSGVPKETNNVRILEVSPDSPALSAGLLPGDVIHSLNGTAVTSSSQFIDLINQRNGKSTKLVVIRPEGNGVAEKNITITPRENPPAGEGPLGIVVSTTEIYYPPVWQRPFYGAYYGFKDAIFWGGAVIAGFAQIFRGLFAGQAPQGLAGPVGIYAITSEVAKAGALALINFVGILSVNLAILNVLPFPALDGGRLLFIVIEAVSGKKVLPKTEATVHTIGMVILLTLLLAVTAHDVISLIHAGSISNFLNSFVK